MSIASVILPGLDRLAGGLGVNYSDNVANCACLDTGVLTEPPRLFQAYDPGFLPSRLDEKLPMNSALLPVLRALWEFLESHTAE